MQRSMGAMGQTERGGNCAGDEGSSNAINLSATLEGVGNRPICSGPRTGRRGAPLAVAQPLPSSMALHALPIANGTSVPLFKRAATC